MSATPTYNLTLTYKEAFAICDALNQHARRMADQSENTALPHSSREVAAQEVEWTAELVKRVLRSRHLKADMAFEDRALPTRAA